jgi:multidrug efflux pump subunit AcrA (membrane-fusion protein)
MRGQGDAARADHFRFGRARRVARRSLRDRSDGHRRAQQTVEVLAEVQGTIEHVRFDEGATVRAGQVLFRSTTGPIARRSINPAVLARDRAQARRPRATPTRRARCAIRT